MTFSRKLRCASVALVVTTTIAVEARAAALLVPAYFDPSDHPAQWAQLTTAASKASLTVVFNPNSGPTNAADASYTAVLASLRAAGGKAIAYVHTKTASGGLRTLSTVEAEVAQYRSQYAFDGVFIDEMSNSTKSSTVTYYTNLYQYIKGLDTAYTVIGNPGTNTAAAYAGAADVLVTEEEPQAAFTSYTPSDWTTAKPAATFATIVYSADATTLSATLKQAASQNFGYVYATDDGADGNPYDTLPSYFSTEVNAVATPEPASVCLFVTAGIGLGVRRRSGTKERA